jgi:hypothetical protein
MSVPVTSAIGGSALHGGTWLTPFGMSGIEAETGKVGAGGEFAKQVHNWATPKATDGTKGGPNQAGSKGDLMLPSMAAQLMTSLRPVRSMIDGRELSPTARTLRPRLNPAFACWLMGWPVFWTNPAITNSAKSETELWRRRLHTHLSRLLDEPESSNNQPPINHLEEQET